MPFIQPGKTSGAIDRNANSADRQRRNWQKMTQGAATSTLSVDGTTIEITSAGALAVNFDTTTMTIAGGNLAIVKPVLQQGTGKDILVTATSYPFYSLDVILKSDGGIKTNSGGVGGFGLYLGLADTSLTTSSTGASVNLATNGGLAVNSGLLVKGFRTVTSAPGSPAAGDTWFNTTTDVPTVDTTGFGVSNIEYLTTVGTIGTAANTTPQTINSWAFPAGYLNRIGSILTLTVFFNGNAAALGNTFTFTVTLGGTTLTQAVTPVLIAGQNYGFVMDVDIVTNNIGSGGSVLAVADGYGAQIGSATQIGTPQSFLTGNLVLLDMTSALTLSILCSASANSGGDTMGIFFAILSKKA